jgi:hypothetical protein
VSAMAATNCPEKIEQAEKAPLVKDLIAALERIQILCARGASLDRIFEVAESEIRRLSGRH